MRVKRAGPSEETAQLGDYLPSTSGLSIHAGPMARWLHVHQREDVSYRLLRYRLQSDSAVAEDETEYELEGNRFVEAAYRTTRNGPNLHEVAIALPATLERNRAYHPPGHGRMTLLHCGSVRVRTLQGEHTLDAVALLSEQENGLQIAQWLGRGLGPLSVGPLGLPPIRWMTHASVAGWPWPVPGDVARLPRLSLPAHRGDGASPTP